MGGALVSIIAQLLGLLNIIKWLLLTVLAVLAPNVLDCFCAFLAGVTALVVDALRLRDVDGRRFV